MTYYKELEALRYLKHNFEKDLVVFSELHNNSKDISIFKYIDKQLEYFRKWYFNEGQVFNMCDLYLDLGESYHILKDHYKSYLVLKTKLEKSLFKKAAIRKKLDVQYELFIKASNNFVKISEAFDQQMKIAIEKTENNISASNEKGKIIKLDISEEESEIIKQFNLEMQFEFEKVVQKLANR